MPIQCHRCDLLQSETWRLSQRLADAERRLTHLAVAVDRLTAALQALRWESASQHRR
jgi:hypothetical protein